MNAQNLQWYETLNDGSCVLVRTIRPSDKPAELAFIKGLSEHSRRMRFLGQTSCLSDEQLRRFTEVDQIHDMAFVAICEQDDRMVGVARYGRQPDGASCECAVTVAEDWQGIGLGVCLMRHLIQFARDQGIRKMVSMDFAENHEMRELAHFLGFKSRQDPDDPRMVVHELALD
jgi:GNAT superfamily N-acetyltransferase